MSSKSSVCLTLTAHIRRTTFQAICGGGLPTGKCRYRQENCKHPGAGSSPTDGGKTKMPRSIFVDK